MELTLNTALLAVLGVSVAVNGWFMREVWAEIKSLRHSRHEHAQWLAEHGVRLDYVEEELRGLRGLKPEGSP